MNNNNKNDDDDSSVLMIILLLGFLALLYVFFGKPSSKGGGGGGGAAPAPSGTSPCESPVEVIPEPTVSTNTCPSNPYTYCSTDTIDKVYITENCSASMRLVNKLINENKLTGLQDPKIIRCCKNPNLCPGIRTFPSVTCKLDPLSIYEGYCP